MVEIIANALALAGQGFRVFPLAPGSKKPPAGLAWKEAATVIPGEVEKLFRDYPGANIGIAAGNGLAVIDVDVKDGKEGAASLECMRSLFDLPATFEVKTPSGGLHIYLKTDARLLNAVDVSDYPGIDIRSDGGYVVAPGSTINGKSYIAVGDPAAVASMPGSLVKELAQGNTTRTTKSETPLAELDTQRSIDLAKDYLLHRAPEAIEGAGGDHATFSVAAACRDYGLSEGVTFDLLLEHWNEQKASPPWMPDELQAKVSNAFQYASGAWGGRTAEAQFDALDIDVGLSPAAHKRAAELAAWPDPVDLWSRFDPPEMPSGVLPSVIESFAMGQAELMGADPGALAMAALTVCAAAMPDSLQVQVKEHDPDWRESSRIWVALVGDPSSKKSPIIHAAVAPLRKIDTRLVKDYASRRREFDALGKEERKTATEPVQRRKLIEDTTAEAAQEVLVGSTEGLLCLQDELSGWLGAMDKYSGGARGAAKDRAFWLQSFNGGAYSTNRITRGASFVDNLSINLLGGIQPDSIRRFARDGVDDGLLQRMFPIVLQPAAMGIDAPRPDTTALYRLLVEALPNISTGENPDLIDPIPELVKFSPEAQLIRRKAEQRHHELSKVEAVSGKLASHIGKLDGLFARLALLWHTIEAVENGMVPVIIPDHVASRVEQFMREYLLPHAFAFYAGTLAQGDTKDALSAIAGHILAKGEKTVTWRTLNRGDSTLRALDRMEAQKLLEQLEYFGWLEPGELRGNQHAARWEVNPKIHVMFADRASVERERRDQTRDILAEIWGK